MRRIFWHLFYLFSHPHIKSQMVKKECRINGWKYQEIRVKILQSSNLNPDHRTETFVFME